MGVVNQLIRIKGTSEEELRAMWHGVDLIKRTGERAYVRAGMRLFREQETDTIKRLRDLYKGSPISRTSKDDFETAMKIFDLQRWYDATLERYGPLVTRSIVQGYRTGAERVAFSTSFPPGDTRARATALEVLQKTKGMNDTTLKMLAKQIGDGVERGETVDELAARVQRVFGAAPWRARTIAQTSATPVFESGQQLAFTDAGIDNKKWLSRRDGLVRDDHIEADGQEVKVDEPFYVGGESLMYPGDTAGSAGNVINCRCTSMAVL